MGLLGSGHCIGMCGPIVMALSVTTAKNKSNKIIISYLLAYNLGRITSYVITGSIVSLFGIFLSSIIGIDSRKIFIIFSSMIMILLGLYLANWWVYAIVRIEKLGAFVWHLIQPMATKFIPIKNIPTAFIAGILWGMLPCGLLYTALIWAMSATSVFDATIIMISFGLGTLPAMMGVGIFSNSFKKYIQNKYIRSVAGLIIISFAIYQLLFFVD